MGEQSYFDGEAARIMSVLAADEIDYHQLLCKYMAHIIEIHGYDYLGKGGRTFTDRELSILWQVSEAART